VEPAAQLVRFRNTFVFAALFLGLAAYLYFVEAPHERRQAEEKKLLHFKPDDVSELTLTYPDREIVLKKTANGWHMMKPIDVDADQSSVSNLVHAVADAEVKRTLEGGGASLDVYGLDKPESIVAITMKDGTKLPPVRVGKAAPVGFSAYVQLQDQKDVKIVPSVFQTGMKREVKDLRNKTIIEFQDADVQAIEIERPQSAVAITRDADGWKIDKPAALKADDTEVNSLLSSLRGTRAEDFVDEPGSLTDYGLDEPREKIAVLVGADKTRKELWLGAEKAKDSKNVLYVKRADSPTVYAVGTWTWSGLNKDVSALRDKTVLRFDKASVAAVEVTRRDGEAYRLVKEAAAASATPAATPAEPAWAVAGAKKSKSAQIADLVADLHGLRGYEIAAEKPADLAPYGLAQPDLTFSLVDAAGKPIGRILASQVGAESSTNAYAMTEGGDVVYHLRPYLYSHLDKKQQDLVEAAPAATPTPKSAP
jgi:Domain of unknown function (DUF4340)